MLGVFLSWHGYGQQFVADTIVTLLKQHFRLEPHKVPSWNISEYVLIDSV
jgi:hypothetical protein